MQSFVAARWSRKKASSLTLSGRASGKASYGETPDGAKLDLHGGLFFVAWTYLDAV